MKRKSIGIVDPRASSVARFVLWIAAPLIVRLAVGCGSPGAPAPPSLNLPAPVKDLSLTRVADSVHLAWTMPQRTTDGVPMKRPLTAEVCRKLENGPCSGVAQLTIGPGKAGSLSDPLPRDLTRGPARLLIYQVILKNRWGKTAGPSNAASTSAGAAPPALTGLAAQVRRDGVLLSWQPIAENDGPIVFRIKREEETAQKVSQSSLTPADTAPVQTLLLRAQTGMDPGHALDTNAQLNRKYRYTVERVAQAVLLGHAVEVQGRPGDPVVVATTDVFPPAVPTGLVAVSSAGAIDLSWSPDSDSDLAGYYVYRRDTQASSTPERISGKTPILGPSFRDPQAERGHTYAYSVSSIDQSGNESARSAEVTESWPGGSQPPP